MKTLTAEQFKSQLVEAGIVKNAIVKGDVIFDFHQPFLPPDVQIVNCYIKFLHISNQPEKITSLIITRGKIGKLDLATSSSFGDVTIVKSTVKNLMIDETSIDKLSFTNSREVATHIDGTRSSVGELILSGHFKTAEFFQFNCDSIRLEKFDCGNFNFMTESASDSFQLVFDRVTGTDYLFQYRDSTNTIRMLKFVRVDVRTFNNISDMG